MSRTPDIRPVEGGASLMVAWRLAGRTVLVIGGGAVAAGRVRQALEADATVKVIAPALCAELRHRWSQGELNWVPRAWHADDLAGVDMVLGCLDDAAQSASLAAAARAARIPVNCADQPEACDFWFTSTHRDGPLQVAVSSHGQAPALGARLLQELARALPAQAGEAMTRFGELRAEVRARTPEDSASGRRMRWLTDLARSWSWQQLASLNDEARKALVSRYTDGQAPPEPEVISARRPRIRLVGAGPGDPRLLTIAAREALEEADLVLADRLVPTEILDLVRGELRIARKLPGRARAAQEELHQWMLEGYHAGRDVVRLKCGDPLVFGRAGEECAFLAGHGISAELIPGITSALSAPLLAGIPTTMRGIANRILIATAHGKEGVHPTPPPFDRDTTYVWLMGVERLDALSDELIGAGFPPDWPAAVVERASHPDQRSVSTTLSRLAATARQGGFAAPATIVVGRAVAAAEALLPATRAAAVG
jgi:uroporphyrin-III C-methyltransferase